MSIRCTQSFYLSHSCYGPFREIKNDRTVNSEAPLHEK
jgi:hypothetical protein